MWMKKLIILDIVTFFCFYMVCFWDIIPNGQFPCFMQWYNVESISNEDNLYLRFLMAWVHYVQIWERLSSESIFTFIRYIESCFFCIAMYSNQSSQCPFSGQSYWDEYFGLTVMAPECSRQVSQVEKWTTIKEQTSAKMCKLVMHRSFIVSVIALFLIQN